MLRKTVLVRIPLKTDIKIKKQQTVKFAVHFGWGIGIRTPTNRVRVCRATVTQFPKIGDKCYYKFFVFICQAKNFQKKIKKDLQNMIRYDIIVEQVIGVLAQLVAHHTGSVGVRGSNPLSSTMYRKVTRIRVTFLFAYITAPAI